MPFKRPAPEPHQAGSQSESSSSVLPPAKHFKPTKALPDTKVYIVQAKLDPSAVAELITLAERNARALCRNAADADVIVTAIGMRRRFERHVPWDIAKDRAVVTPDWLRDCVASGGPVACEDYVAIEDLHQATVENCPECNCQPCGCSDDSTSDVLSPRAAATALSSPPSSSAANARPMSPEFLLAVDVPANLLSPTAPRPTSLDKLDYTSRYACQRASPLVCPNQELVRELDVIRRSRALEGEARSALSYSRAISAVKAYPLRIHSMKQVSDLPYVGTKISTLVEEFIDTGRIAEARTIASSTRFAALSLFSSVYGIGPNTARRLYGLGLRTLDDLEVHYGVERGAEANEGIIELEESPRKPGWIKGANTSDEGLGDGWIRVALEMREDFEKKIPRRVVEEIGRTLMQELERVQPGCVSTIVGGYRRGKAESNDVDIVFTHPDASTIKGLCKRFVQHLNNRGMVTHVMHLGGFHGHDPLRTTHWDSLEKALTVFVLPLDAVRRRVDLIFAPPAVYWTAVIGWSGSIMFQRDLRQWAKDKLGMKFDSSGITRRYDSAMLFPKTEKEVFDLLGLEWVAPEWRNADA